MPGGAEVEVPAGATLLDAALAAGLPVARSCGADGVCGRCGLRVVEGGNALSPEEPDEARIKQRNRVAPELRLACRAHVHGDVVATADYW